MIKLSQLVGMPVYAENGKMLGKVYDVIIDLQTGTVVRLTLEPVHASSVEEAKRVFREKTVNYKSVKAVHEIVIVSDAPIQEEAEAPAPKPPEHFSYRRRLGLK